MAARWAIISQYPEMFYPRNAEPVPGRRFTIREESTGSEDEFWLSETNLQPERVAQEAQERADRIEQFSKLGQG
jgi:hypothetical protein